jgi:hypothetical protein
MGLVCSHFLPLSCLTFRPCLFLRSYFSWGFRGVCWPPLKGSRQQKPSRCPDRGLECREEQQGVKRVQRNRKVPLDTSTGLAKTIYNIYTYTVYMRYFWQGVTKYTVIYGAYIQLWPTLHIYSRASTHLLTGALPACVCFAQSLFVLNICFTWSSVHSSCVHSRTSQCNMHPPNVQTRILDKDVSFYNASEVPRACRPKVMLTGASWLNPDISKRIPSLA